MKKLIIEIEELLSASGVGNTWLMPMVYIIHMLLTALLAWGVYKLCYLFLMPMLTKIAKKTEATWDDLLLNPHSQRALCRIAPAIVVWLLLPEVFYRLPAIVDVAERVTSIYITVMTMLMCLSVVDAFKNYEDKRHTALQQYYHTFCGVLKILIIFLSVIVMVAIAINRSPLTLIAGLGATSAILMLVFKDTISGLVAGIRLTSNDMLHRGDWITVPKADINGIVEDITLTTVKVRNFDNTILTITPQTLVDDSFQNWIGMRQGNGRRVKRMVYFDFLSIRPADDALRTTLSTRYGFKPEEMEPGVVNMTLFRRYVERYLGNHPDVNTDMMFVVRQLEATNTGLPIEFYFFLKQKEWKHYEHQLADIMDRIYAIIPDFGLTVYQRYSDGQRT